MSPFQDLRTPEGIAAAKKRAAKADRERARVRRDLEAAKEASAGKWNPIESMPFAGYSSTFDEVLVSGGDAVAVVRVHRRFGTPIRVIKEPVMALTDEGLSWVGGEYEDVDAPGWWLQWEFEDQLGHESEMYGKPEISFTPTHWMPMPAPPNHGTV